MTLKALNDYVVIRPNKDTSYNQNGLFLTNTTIATGTVITVGSLCESVVKDGDLVALHVSQTGSTVRLDQTSGDVWIVPERVLLAILNYGDTSGS